MTSGTDWTHCRVNWRSRSNGNGLIPIPASKGAKLDYVFRAGGSNIVDSFCGVSLSLPCHSGQITVYGGNAPLFYKQPFIFTSQRSTQYAVRQERLYWLDLVQHLRNANLKHQRT